jgi:hypothetical protein
MPDTQPVQQTAQSAAMQKFYSEARQATAQLLEAHQKLLALQNQWHALDYGNNLEPGDGIHHGLVANDVGAVVHATADAINTLMIDGHHRGNLAKLL